MYNSKKEDYYRVTVNFTKKTMLTEINPYYDWFI